jgi:hypothetical protein
VDALGYTKPDQDLILLRKGLRGEARRKVIEHEVEHLKKGEEGPLLGAALALGAGSYLSGRESRKGAGAASASAERQAAIARGDLSPYREFGAESLTGLKDWMASPEGQYRDPTMEEVMASPGYESRLGAIESSAAARGGLLSGNALRNIGEFGEAEFGAERNRRMQDWTNNFNRRMQMVNLGYGAAGGSAGISQNLGSQLSNIDMMRGQQSAQNIQNLVGGGMGLYGMHQGQQQANKFLEAYNA